MPFGVNLMRSPVLYRAAQGTPLVLVLCSIQEQRSSVAVLLAGTSGTGKSTLAGLLAARLGITTVLSTDNIRHMLRSFAAEDQNPLLWASTYQVKTLTGCGLRSRFCVTNVVVLPGGRRHWVWLAIQVLCHDGIAVVLSNTLQK